MKLELNKKNHKCDRNKFPFSRRKRIENSQSVLGETEKSFMHYLPNGMPDLIN